MLRYPKTKRVKSSKVKDWDKARAILKKEYLARGIVRCEVNLAGCKVNNFLSFAHRYKRRDKQCEHTYKGTILACIPCHTKLEANSELTNYYFELLRP